VLVVSFRAMVDASWALILNSFYQRMLADAWYPAMFRVCLYKACLAAGTITPSLFGHGICRRI
jgi:hypothetical protein